MSAPTICTTITGEKVAVPFRTIIQQSTSTLSPPPKLVGILANSDAPSRTYAEWTKKACAAVGIEYELWEVKGKGGEEGKDEGKAGQGDVEEAILKANEDRAVNGIMVYYPIFGPRGDDYLRQSVSPLKDVEGLNFTWLFSLYHNARFVDPKKLLFASQSLSAASPDIPASITNNEEGKLVKAILPCTPLAIVKTLEHCQVYNPLLPYGSRLYGKTITVINRSEVVGRPLAALLSNDGARVFSIDIDSIQEFTRRKESTNDFAPRHFVRELKEQGEKGEWTTEICLELSDVVVSGVPAKAYQIPTASLKLGCVCINFSESKNFETDVKTKAGIYCPGIGKVTIAMLQRNLLRLKEYQDLLNAQSTAVATA